MDHDQVQRWAQVALCGVLVYEMWPVYDSRRFAESVFLSTRSSAVWYLKFKRYRIHRVYFTVVHGSGAHGGGENGTRGVHARVSRLVLSARQLRCFKDNRRVTDDDAREHRIQCHPLLVRRLQPVFLSLLFLRPDKFHKLYHCATHRLYNFGGYTGRAKSGLRAFFQSSPR